MIWSLRTNHCRVFYRHLKTQARYAYRPEEDIAAGHAQSDSLATPRELVKYLDQFVIGQQSAKKVLSVAVYNHYNRVQANLEAQTDEKYMQWHEESQPEATHSESGVTTARIHPRPRRFPPIQQPLPLLSNKLPLFEKSNVLVIGPTGSGKTLLARTLANVIDVPFSINDATSFTQAGYVGEDVEMCVQRLLQAADWDPYRASTGIIYIDEIDKIARKSSSGADGTRDVGGEGVQQALLRMMEGSIVSVSGKGNPHEAAGSVGNEGRPRSGRGSSGPAKHDTYHIDTSNILFILSGAFVGLDSIVKRRVVKGSIGFTANLSSKSEESEDSLPFFTPNTGIARNVLDMVQPSDLMKYGLIPEFISRMPSVTTLSQLTPSDLRRVLTEVKGSLVQQYTALFGYSGVEIRFTNAALCEICRKAAERGGGARGLRGMMESLLLDPMYEVPGSDIRHVLITRAVVLGQSRPLTWPHDGAAECWSVYAKEEAMWGDESP